MKSLLARLATGVLQWHSVLSGSGPAALFVGTLFAAAVVAHLHQAAELLERLKAIEPDSVLVAIGEALFPFSM